jgi:hypothetical protein
MKIGVAAECEASSATARTSVNTGLLAGEVTVLGDGSPVAPSAGSPAGEPNEPLSPFPSPPRQTERDPTELNGLHRSIEQGASGNPGSRSRGRPTQSLLKGGGEEIRGCGQRHHAHAVSEISNANPTQASEELRPATRRQTVKQGNNLDYKLYREATPPLSVTPASKTAGGGQKGASGRGVTIKARDMCES